MAFLSFNLEAMHCSLQGGESKLVFLNHQEIEDDKYCDCQQQKGDDNWQQVVIFSGGGYFSLFLAWASEF